MTRRTLALTVTVALLVALTMATPALALKKKSKEAKEDEGPFTAATFAGLSWRSVGPALTSGRISDIAVHPQDHDTWIIAVASGGVWKTTNAGTTWKPVMDGAGSYSFGCVTYDPSNPLIVWVGSGENNSQRSVSYGDGVYRSIDGGDTFENVGLKESEHIGRIVVDPRDSNVVWVAAQGPLWNAGGERGLYKTTDGGATWERVLHIDDDTGVNDVLLDPRDPDVVYASSYQRRRRVWTLINGGPGSGIHKSTDGGATWTELTKGLPDGDMGRIGLAIPEERPDTIYAIVEAERDLGGFFRSTNAGASWEKRSDYVAGSPQYYNEITVDPHDPERIYSMDTFLQVSEDGGASWSRVGNSTKHVDDHAIWIDPDDPDHFLSGCDGGLYETFDRGKTWDYFPNIPITQFYKVTPDNDAPFYNIYGGTQDNFTLGGPSRNTSASGIVNSDWFVTLGGDGFEPQIDPTNPDIVYSQYQYGGLARYDRKSGEILDIQPQPGAADAPLRWNWDSALIISPHSHTRLYFAAQRVFRSDDRGDSWTPISEDLTRGQDWRFIETMGRVQRADAVAKGDSTSRYGNIVAMSESPLEEGLLYAGTDDGLIQVLEGDAWRKIDSFPGVPSVAYVSDVETSRHAADRVYAVFDDHKSGNFKPYVLRSDDRGASWRSIAGDLPERGTVYTIVEDAEREDLLFVGTEFGVWFTVNGGTKWVELSGGMPTIAVRDLEIQRRENDLVAGTFGRGFYVLDDYTPLRSVTEEMLKAEGTVFEPRDVLMYVESYPLGLKDKSFQGDRYFTAPNPPFGAVVTYHLAEGFTTLRDQRLKTEKEREEAGEAYEYPSFDALRAEAREEKPTVVLTVRDADGEIVRRMTGPSGKGFSRVAWDLRYPAAVPASLSPREPGLFGSPDQGPMVAPGTYTVELAARVEGALRSLSGPVDVVAQPAGFATLAAEDKAALVEFQRDLARLQRAVLGAQRAAGEMNDRIEHIKVALMDTPGVDVGLEDRVRGLDAKLQDLVVKLSGDRTLARYNEPQLPSISSRVSRVVGTQWTVTQGVTGTSREGYRVAGEAFGPVLAGLRDVDVALEVLEGELEAAGAPWTPGTVPEWRSK